MGTGREARELNWIMSPGYRPGRRNLQSMRRNPTRIHSHDAHSSMTFSDLQSIVKDVRYKDWTFSVRAGSSWYIQLEFSVNGEQWKGRKWTISSHATPSEVVQTCLLAVLTAEEHEAREQFTYLGKAVFNPHISINSLLDVCEDTDPRLSIPA